MSHFEWLVILCLLLICENVSELRALNSCHRRQMVQRKRKRHSFQRISTIKTFDAFTHRKQRSENESTIDRDCDSQRECALNENRWNVSSVAVAFVVVVARKKADYISQMKIGGKTDQQQICWDWNVGNFVCDCETICIAIHAYFINVNPFTPSSCCVWV